jgi:hypothetical protein
MIVWPDETRMKSESRDALRRFRETAAAAQLEASPEEWTVVAWPWTPELPLRVVLENASRHVITCTMREGGMWLWAEEPREYHIRSAESLDRDARGLPYR